tara:strand:+ start:47 stop:817 length:771 start_codon:yes stop_codon:yes gene_type:complete
MIQWAVSIAIILGVVLSSVAGLVIARRVADHTYLRQHNDVAGFIYSVVGILYGVLLAFIVIAVWEEYEDAGRAIDAEASVIREIYRDSGALPDGFRTEVRRALLAYTDVLAQHEWQALSEGQGRGSAAVDAALNHLWATYDVFVPQDANDKIWYAEIIRRMNALESYRKARILASKFELPGIMWAVLLLGGAIVIVFAYLFGTANASAHLLMVGALAATVSMAILLIWALEHPFSGLAHVSDQPIRLLHAQLLTIQ